MGIVVRCFLGVLDVYDSTGEEILGNGAVVVEIPYYTSLKILVTFTPRSPEIQVTRQMTPGVWGLSQEGGVVSRSNKVWFRTIYSKQ